MYLEDGTHFQFNYLRHIKIKVYSEVLNLIILFSPLHPWIAVPGLQKLLPLEHYYRQMPEAIVYVPLSKRQWW